MCGWTNPWVRVLLYGEYNCSWPGFPLLPGQEQAVDLPWNLPGSLQQEACIYGHILSTVTMRLSVTHHNSSTEGFWPSSYGTEVSKNNATDSSRNRIWPDRSKQKGWDNEPSQLLRNNLSADGHKTVFTEKVKLIFHNSPVRQPSFLCLSYRSREASIHSTANIK